MRVLDFYWIAVSVVVCLLLPPTTSLNNGVGRVPAMGFNTWNKFRCEINEGLIKEVADAMVSSGLRDAGYTYLNIDDCWQERRDPSGHIVPNLQKFPSGMKHLADFVHSRGLKFGLYSDTGNKTCEGFPGSWGHEALDAQTYASWGVDYLKYDFCYMETSTEPVEVSYGRMSQALNATGRPILFSLCSWGNGLPWNWGQRVGNSWRTDADLFAVWDAQAAAKLKLPSNLKPVMRALEVVEQLSESAGPGGFNDPDMLVVGLDGMSPFGVINDCPDHIKGCVPGTYISRERWGVVGGLTYTEQKTHFALWCMLSAPLMLGNDPRSMTKATLSILTNPELLAISQDPLAKQAKKVYKDGSASIWVKPLADGRVAALLFNEGETPLDIFLVYNRDMPEQATPWNREIPPPDCADKRMECRQWALDGACDNNSPLMWAHCRTSCPAACPKDPLPPGPRATAIVRDAWQEDDWIATGLYRAHLVEPHEGRVLIVRFVEPFNSEHAQDRTTAAHGQSKVINARHTVGHEEGRARELYDPGSGEVAKELRLQVSKLSAELDHVNGKVKEMDSVAETLAIASAAQQRQQQEQATRAQQQEMIRLSGQASSAVAGVADNRVWLLLLCNAGVLVLLLVSQCRQPRWYKPDAHSR